jgi:hypothetical protein
VHEVNIELSSDNFTVFNSQFLILNSQLQCLVIEFEGSTSNVGDVIHFVFEGNMRYPANQNIDTLFVESKMAFVAGFASMFSTNKGQAWIETIHYS